MPPTALWRAPRYTTEKTALALRADVVIIHHILFHILDGDLSKAGFAQQLLSLVSAPHRAETLTPEGQ